MSAGAVGGAAGLGQLQGLRDSGLIDADTFELIEATMANPTAELDRLHASGAISDEIYAQAIASMPTAAAGAGAGVDAAELDLLQRGAPATATVLALPESSDGDARLPVTLEVHPAAGPSYEVRCTIAAVHPVMVDPDDPKRVAIDWAEFGT
jgi:hypothetical protein